MAKKKRVNPRRIPMAREAVDKKALLEGANHENLPIAWTLVVHAMLKQGLNYPVSAKPEAGILMNP